MAKEEATNNNIKTGSVLMLIGALSFMVYALLFLVRNFTSAFLELGITSTEVDKSKMQLSRLVLLCTTI